MLSFTCRDANRRRISGRKIDLLNLFRSEIRTRRASRVTAQLEERCFSLCVAKKRVWSAAREPVRPERHALWTESLRRRRLPRGHGMQSCRKTSCLPAGSWLKAQLAFVGYDWKSKAEGCQIVGLQWYRSRILGFIRLQLLCIEQQKVKNTSFLNIIDTAYKLLVLWKILTQFCGFLGLRTFNTRLKIQSDILPKTDPSGSSVDPHPTRIRLEEACARSTHDLSFSGAD